MKRLIFLFFTLFLCFETYCINKSIQADLSYSLFYSPADGPYIETYLSISGKSCTFFKNEHNKYQARTGITLLFKQNNKIVQYKKYTLYSQEINDTLDNDFNFIDQQRILLENGSYDFEININDLNNVRNPVSYIQPLIVDLPENKINISSIQLIDTIKKSNFNNILSKNGYDLLPKVVYFYPKNLKKITFYSEIYNTNKLFKDKIIIKYYIENFENQTIANELAKVKVEAVKNVIVLLKDFDISSLPSGNYNLVIEARDSINRIITSNKTFFQRSNPEVGYNTNDLGYIDINLTFMREYNDSLMLKEFIKSLYPISTIPERSFADNQLYTSNIRVMKQYFFNFWYSRNRLEPEKAWLSYNEEVKKTNSAFATKIKKGYETERGRVYLQYGPPNVISENENEPSAYPYQIWQYYSLKNQKNKKFVFYNRDLVTNDYELIHSDAIGEINDYNWENIIYNRNTPPGTLDPNKPKSHWGSKVDDYFNQPR